MDSPQSLLLPTVDEDERLKVLSAQNSGEYKVGDDSAFTEIENELGLSDRATAELLVHHSNRDSLKVMRTESGEKVMILNSKPKHKSKSKQAIMRQIAKNNRLSNNAHSKAGKYHSAALNVRRANGQKFHGHSDASHTPVKAKRSSSKGKVKASKARPSLIERQREYALKADNLRRGIPAGIVSSQPRRRKINLKKYGSRDEYDMMALKRQAAAAKPRRRLIRKSSKPKTKRTKSGGKRKSSKSRSSSKSKSKSTKAPKADKTRPRSRTRSGSNSTSPDSSKPCSPKGSPKSTKSGSSVSHSPSISPKHSAGEGGSTFQRPAKLDPSVFGSRDEYDFILLKQQARKRMEQPRGLYDTDDMPNGTLLTAVKEQQFRRLTPREPRYKEKILATRFILDVLRKYPLVQIKFKHYVLFMLKAEHEMVNALSPSEFQSELENVKRCMEAMKARRRHR